MKRCWQLKSEEAKTAIKKKLGEQIKFEGHFEKVFDNLNPTLQKSLIEWANNCKEGKEKPAISPRYSNILVFFFKPSVTNIRGILTKEKNEYFLVLYLDKHKYYDRERDRLGF